MEEEEERCEEKRKCRMGTEEKRNQERRQDA